MGHRAEGVGQFGAAGVVDGQAEDHAGVGTADADGFAEFVEHPLGQALFAAEVADLDVVVHDGGPFTGQVEGVEVHEGLDLVFGAFPVFGAEGVEGEAFDAKAGTFGDDGADGFAALAVAVDAGQALAFGPAAVAVQDDGNVAGHFLPGDAEDGMVFGRMYWVHKL